MTDISAPIFDFRESHELTASDAYIRAMPDTPWAAIPISHVTAISLRLLPNAERPDGHSWQEGTPLTG